MASRRRVDFDPEVAELTKQVRAVVNQAHQLTDDISSTMEKLQEYLIRTEAPRDGA